MAKPCSQGLNECVGHKQQPIIAPMTVSQAVPRDTVHWRSSHRQDRNKEALGKSDKIEHIFSCLTKLVHRNFSTKAATSGQKAHLTARNCIH